MLYGPERLLQETRQLGHRAELVSVEEGLQFVVVSDFEVAFGRFNGRVIDLGLPATPDFPRSVGASIHVRADPQLLEYEHVPGVRNIIVSKLGSDWRYWSHNFQWAGERERSAGRLFAQVNKIFERA
jgi:hypothetical protein